MAPLFNSAAITGDSFLTGDESDLDKKLNVEVALSTLNVIEDVIDSFEVRMNGCYAYVWQTLALRDDGHRKYTVTGACWSAISEATNLTTSTLCTFATSHWRQPVLRPIRRLQGHRMQHRHGMPAPARTCGTTTGRRPGTG